MSYVQLVNLTPHGVSVFNDKGKEVLVIPPIGTVARVKTKQEVVDTLKIAEGLEIPVVKTEFGEVTGLPEPSEGYVYIVSTLVAQAVNRDDVVSPDTGPIGAVRSNEKEIVIHGPEEVINVFYQELTKQYDEDFQKEAGIKIEMRHGGQIIGVKRFQRW